MKINNEWKDFEVLATGNGEKLERWGEVILLRPDPQIIWKSKKPLNSGAVFARYERSVDGGGRWQNFKKMPESWKVSWRNLVFTVKPMGFKHTGLFPEQAVNWDIIIDLIKNAKRDISVLNLFAYTGGATMAALSAGATVCHVDSAKQMVERAKENIIQSKLPIEKARFIVDDCIKFVKREISRGKHYDAIIMDPPSFGRGINGEVWKLENDIAEFLKLCAQVLSSKPLFVLTNSYTTGLQPVVLENLLALAFEEYNGKVESYEVCLPTCEGIVLPCGASGLWKGEK